MKKQTTHHIPNSIKKDLPNPNCKCGKPMRIVIQPGQHIHPCPVHPDKAVYGLNIIYRKPLRAAIAQLGRADVLYTSRLKVQILLAAPVKLTIGKCP